MYRKTPVPVSLLTTLQASSLWLLIKDYQQPVVAAKFSVIRKFKQSAL